MAARTREVAGAESAQLALDAVLTDIFRDSPDDAARVLVRAGVRYSMTGMTPGDKHLAAALVADDASVRLSAALAIGSTPHPSMVDVLIARCAVEPDFYVRDMLTWALTRLPSEETVPRLLAELGSDRAQARSQALHTLSKIREATTWPAITQSLLRDSDDDVARSAWRAAVILVPDEEKAALADELAVQLGRNGREVQLSLSRALVALGEAVVEPVLRKVVATGTAGARAHALATIRLLRDPAASVEGAVHEAKRAVALGEKGTDG